ncbi:DNA repair protein RadA/Sms [Candidatus Kryptonium thompsonii]|uniref:DNA repair protein RadA n=2 Tax=Candidatus Kryptonium thompsonii TaxID=1633631 RepID=A0A0N7MS13_9BACT|nr:DNA repair protein RadA [Candidatus Kryptonium thompsoni]CUS82318.1 DNA repair protein RadA/Sms [Candidatus Kryptonium thompsoni]CUS86163.1 DNA repair protein RadA/Sms [Candidatus Kryptonium thompsoni]CUS89339.1 DNA repair protein RadA/Sms [Candidatus Kryptonium thompsoni]CUS92412.1 DNA repair protein RadA/Sms [Candidatus Kryptonium thompsoni]CUS93757.1 DNA repair protein RadA/Sms [Candidatus Kryptonium thompsoni]
MAKQKTQFICQNCGYISLKWMGRCPECNEWNTMVEEIVMPEDKLQEQISLLKQPAIAVDIDKVELKEDERIKTGINELDRVLGGGIVPGSVVLVAGDPGVGKSTLMTQIVPGLKGKKILYVTGEESIKQLKLRTERLNFPKSFQSRNFLVLAETNLNLIINVIEETNPDIIIIDSIQTMYRPELESSPGSVSQVRECASLLMQIAKNTGKSILLVGHVTKDGLIAGPKVLEHMVDTVLQFEGERHQSYRILRAVKNRFGSTNEIGIFEMTTEGLKEVKNPSEIFLSERTFGVSGSSVVACIEGTRPLLVEVQALVTPATYGTPQRTAIGFDYHRLSVLLAVLEKKVGIRLSGYDVFIKIVGGLRIDEPAIDLGVVTSIVSSLKDIPVDSQSVVVGEVGLSGEVRSVTQIERRVQESAKLGFKKIIIPKNNMRGLKVDAEIEIVGIKKVNQALEELLNI